MQKIDKSFNYTCYTSSDELSPEDRELLIKAREATKLSYAPYSKFHVGGAARLTDGQILCGSNQENVSFGATICAERTLLGTISSIAPTKAINTIAISYHNPEGTDNTPISPCGICRQSLLEHENMHNQPMRIILGGLCGEVWIINGAQTLLPLAFSSLVRD